MCLLDLSLYEPNNQVIAAEGEQKASRALREAADVISESPAALQVSEIILQLMVGFNCDLIILLTVTRYLQHNIAAPPDTGLCMESAQDCSVLCRLQCYNKYDFMFLEYEQLSESEE